MNKDKDIKNITDNFADFILDELEDDLIFNEDDIEDDLDDIDEELLFDVLDQIANIDKIEPELRININKEKKLIQTIQKVIRNEYLSDPPMDLSKRPPICVDCEADNCTHIINFDFSKGTNIIEMAQNRCEHISEDDYIGTCIDCIKKASEDLKNRVINKNILHLWDSIDMANYYRIKIENELEYGLLN